MNEVNNPILGYADSYRLMVRMAEEDRKPAIVSLWSVITDLERNMAPLMTESLAREAALREELANAQQIPGSFEKCMQAMTDRDAEAKKVDALKQSLTAAEQRNAELVKLLRQSTAGGGQDFKQWWNERATLLLACTKPTEPGASDEN